MTAELRRVPPVDLGSRGRSAHHAIVQPMKPAPFSRNGQNELYRWTFAAGEEMQLDLLFAPSFLKDKTPGLRTATMKFSGAGTITPWTVMIPMRGIVNPLKLNLEPQGSTPLSSQQPAAMAKAANKPDVNSMPAASGQTGPSGQAALAAGKFGTSSDNKRALGRSDRSQPTASSSAVAARPSPTPIAPLSPPSSSAFIDNTPQHSPDQFDFGEVWNGDYAKKTLYLTTNAAGYVTIPDPRGAVPGR